MLIQGKGNDKGAYIITFIPEGGKRANTLSAIVAGESGKWRSNTTMVFQQQNRSSVNFEDT
jgi:hypothetical protein